MCPRCGYEYVCGCNSCKDMTRGKIRWRFEDGDWEACGRCGLLAHVDVWFDEFYSQAKEHDNDSRRTIKLSKWWRIPLERRRATS